MKNTYLENLSKIEFVVTNACTGRCKHCSEGDHAACGERIDPQIAADAVRKVAAVYDIKTVMTFGGEPLLYTDAVYAIMTAAKELNISKRQVITNGYFSKSREVIRNMAEELAATRRRWDIYDIRTMFDDEFFETKRVVYTPYK